MAIVQDTDELTTSAAPKRRMSMAQRDAAWGLAFLSPWLIGLGLFTAVPMIFSLVLSFTNFDIVNPANTHFVFLDNYKWMFTDHDTQTSFIVTMKFAVLAIPITLFTSLGVAILVNNKLLAGKRVFRTLFFMPVQIPLVASTIVWLDFLNGNTGWLKYILEGIAHALSNIPFLNFMGDYTLIFLAGLQSVPTELYEAARVDGAGAWRQFLAVTLPMISPVFFYNLLLNIIGTAQYFTQVYVLAGPLGNPDHATYVYNLNLYNVAWRDNQMGRGCALAWFMFVIVLGASVVLFRTSARWVFYAGADK
jgi:multiple sugar transport system permease protein